MDRSLKTYASHHLVVVYANQKTHEALLLMEQHGVRHLPVVSDRGEIIGIISHRDLQRAVGAEQGKTPRAESVVADYMSWPIESIDEGKTIGEAARAMIDRKISSLLITSGDKIVGIVTTEDLLRALLEAAETPAQKMKRELEGTILKLPISQVAQALANAGI